MQTKKLFILFGRFVNRKKKCPFLSCLKRVGWFDIFFRIFGGQARNNRGSFIKLLLAASLIINALAPI